MKEHLKIKFNIDSFVDPMDFPCNEQYKKEREEKRSKFSELAEKNQIVDKFELFANKLPNYKNKVKNQFYIKISYNFVDK